jgi:hypothetical protein
LSNAVALIDCRRVVLIWSSNFNQHSCSVDVVQRNSVDVVVGVPACFSNWLAQIQIIHRVELVVSLENQRRFYQFPSRGKRELRACEASEEEKK